MSRLRLAVTAIVLAVFAGVVGTQILVSPSVVSADIGGGRAGPRGATGRTGPTGPNWTTCAELASSMTNEVGTCGSLGGPLLSASPTTTGTLTAAGISAVTGVFSSTLDVAGAVGITGAVTARAGVTITQSTTNGAAVTATGNGSGAGGAFTGGSTGAGVTGTCTGASCSGASVSCTTGNACTGVAASCNASNCSAGSFTANTNGNGYAVKLISDTTSPTFGTINMPPLDTNPSSASGAIGDLFMFTGGILRVEVATTPLWADVSGYRSMRLGWTAHAGGGQASAPVICVEPGNWSSVTTVASAGDSVKLPASFIAGGLCHGKNLGANSMNLFPNSGDQLCFSGSACAAADAAVAIGTNVEFTCQARAANAAQWDCR